MFFKPTITLLVLGGLLGAPLAHAQSEAVKAARETVMENLTSIKEVQSSPLSTEEKAEKERILKKTALSNLLSLSILETEDILARLRALVLDGPYRTLVPLKTDLIEKLESYEGYFGALREVLDATENIADIRELASQFEAKREASYNRDLKRSVELLVALHVDEVLSKAQDRLEKLTLSVKRSKGTKGELLVRNNLLRTASLHLSQAELLAENTREKLSAYLDVQPKKESVQLETFSLKEKEPTLQKLAEESILHTREAYKSFIELQDLLNSKSLK